METLDLTLFEKALLSLFEVIDVYKTNTNNLIVRDSLIQRFEYTYSISLKMIRRYIVNYSIIDENVDTLSFNSMIRLANKQGLLLSSLEKWDDYRKKRNLTSHTYDEKIAKEVVCVIEDFSKDAEFLLAKLKEKLS